VEAVRATRTTRAARPCGSRRRRMPAGGSTEDAGRGDRRMLQPATTSHHLLPTRAGNIPGLNLLLPTRAIHLSVPMLPPSPGEHPCKSRFYLSRLSEILFCGLQIIFVHLISHGCIQICLRCVFLCSFMSVEQLIWVSCSCITVCLDSVIWLVESGV
jgi:hypothetical protein